LADRLCASGGSAAPSGDGKQASASPIIFLASSGPFDFAQGRLSARSTITISAFGIPNSIVAQRPHPEDLSLEEGPQELPQLIAGSHHVVVEHVIID
jgi:hypothetical protein